MAGLVVLVLAVPFPWRNKSVYTFCCGSRHAILFSVFIHLPIVNGTLPITKIPFFFSLPKRGKRRRIASNSVPLFLGCCLPKKILP